MFATLFMTWPKIRYPIDNRCFWYSCPHDGLLLTVLLMADAIVAPAKKHTQLKTRVLKPYLKTKIDTLFITKTAKKPYPLGPHTPILPDFIPWRTRYESVNYGISNYWSSLLSRQSNGRRGFDSHRGQKNFFFTSCGSQIPFTRANAQWVFHGFNIVLKFTLQS